MNIEVSDKNMAGHVAKSLQAVKTVIDAMGTVQKPQFCEFEMRLGQNGKGGFTPGVDAHFVGALLCKLETSPAWSEITPWTQIVDRFYLLPSGLQVRTSSQAARFNPDTEKDARVVPEYEEEEEMYSDDESEEDMEDEEERSMDTPDSNFSYETSHVIKTAIAHVDLKWISTEDKDILRSRDGTVYGMRIGLKQEAPVFEDELQECVEETNTVRIKQRRSFRYTPHGKDRVQWAIEVTQVWQSATYTDAMACLRRGDEPRYEVEIECLDVYDYLKSLGGDTKRLSLSILLKAADLFGIDADSECKLVPY